MEELNGQRLVRGLWIGIYWRSRLLHFKNNWFLDGRNRVLEGRNLAGHFSVWGPKAYRNVVKSRCDSSVVANANTPV